MRKKVFFIMLLLSVLVNGTCAQEEHLKLHFDFSKVNGMSVTDVAGSINASMIGSVTIDKVGKYNVLNLGNGTGYLNMISAAGSIIKNLGDFTVSACYFVSESASLSGNGFFFTTFCHFIYPIIYTIHYFRKIIPYTRLFMIF